ncbi:DUF3426 domain-containing protein [Stutzerimonas stutzeri]
MTSFVTQCPHCRTSFRVSRAQLAAARGVVRCGACMELFNAAQQLSDEDKLRASAAETPAPAPVSVPVQSSAPSNSEDDTLWIHDDLDLDSLDLDEELARLEREELELARELLQLEQTQPHTASPDDDEAWAERLLGAETTQAPVPAPVSQALPEPDMETAKVPPDTVMPSATPLDTALPQPAERLEPSLSEPEEADSGWPAADSTPATQAHARERKDRDAPLFELEDEPLQLDWEARRHPWGRWLGWGALNLLALLALAGQYVFYNFDELARQDQYRPWLEQLCPALGCELPSRVDIDQIRSSNLVVRSHPDFTGALIVDAIIYNRASFAQPFPLLEMRFTDISGQVLASRTFKPGEYLSGELAGQRQMPSQIPIHIALDILDPGTSAVSYSLAFHSPE